ncbi:Ribonuclease H-like superfamily [Sesbania bispinosa]|nr:Ribonuclease H-like superfamily [Sesbania bispinosa]
MWRFLQGTLPVRSNLIRRGINCDTRCIWCGDNSETDDHLFRDCPRAVSTWAQSSLKLQVQSLPIGPFRNWFHDHILCCDVERERLFVAICYGQWFARNKRIFEDREIPIHRILSKAYESLAFSSLPISRVGTTSPNSSTHGQHWEAPHDGIIKINSDAAMGLDGNWGIGIVARDSEGFVLAAASRKINTIADVSTAEVLGIRLSMEFALDLSFEYVIFEFDCKIVMDQLQGVSFHNSYTGLICQDCHVLRSNFRRCNFSHVRRNGNYAAHF